jgi:hypothetical protein
MTTEGTADAHWVRWHRSYEDPDSPLSARLRLVQAGVRRVLYDHLPGPIRVASMCAGQGRDVIDVVASHARRADVRAVLVELDPGLVEFACARAAAVGLGDLIEVVQGDAALVRYYSDVLPADLVLVCGVFGNISETDIRATVTALPSLCAPGATVIWTRHRRPPDLTPTIRAWFAAAGFEEVSFDAPEPYVLSVGCHRLRPAPADEAVARSTAAVPDAATRDRHLFDFTGDGALPA